MKPKHLEFCGINSFSEKAVVDFDRLSSGGIFGIFGDTGSGKTTILDSIVFALYGRVDRVRGGTVNELINYNCEKAYVIFDFETVVSGARKLFRVEREIRRKNSAQTLKLSELKDGREIALSEGVKPTNAAILELVGLSFEDFKKCIALPQGEFAQFVKADRAERLQLISRLFGLEKYGTGLNERIRDRYAAVKSAYDAKEGELKGYADASAEALELRRALAAASKAEKLALDSRYSALQTSFEQMKTGRDRFLRLQALQSKREGLLSRADAIREMRAVLNKLPAAQEIAARSERMAKRGKEISQIREECALADARKKQAAEFLRACREQDEEARQSAALEACSKRLTAVEYAAKDAAAAQKLHEELAKLRAQRAEKEKQREEREAALRLAAGRSEKAAAALRAAGEIDLGSFLSENIESALLRGEYERALRHFTEKRGQLQAGFKPEGPLFAWAEEELSSLIAFYRARLESRKADDLTLLLEQFRRRSQERERLKAAVHAAETEQVRAQSALSETDGLLQGFAGQEETLSEQLRAIDERIRESVGTDRNGLPELGRRLRAQMQKLSEELEEIRRKKEAAQKAVSEADVTAARADAALQKLSAAAAEDEAAIADAVAAGGFENADAAGALLGAYPDAGAVRKEVDAFDHELLTVEANIRLLGEEGEAEPVTEEQFRQVQDAYAACSAKRQEAAEQCAVLESSCADLQRRLSVRMKLESEYAALKADLERIAKLRELVRGNNFMEFVAAEYLSDISKQASGTLLHLTGGRYFVRYNQGFLVGDNLCGGELRGVNTMSGGETFLVSLSLALSLSAAIYAKSLKPIEFFFLDEGFGTLDEKLVELVIDSLEKLKNNHFTIGLISHVEELKHRIDHKITVIGAAENGSSSIRISD